MLKETSFDIFAQKTGTINRKLIIETFGIYLHSQSQITFLFSFPSISNLVFPLKDNTLRNLLLRLPIKPHVK